MVFKRYNPTPNELELIRGILTYDMEKRLTPLQALRHPYFQDIQNLPESEVVPGLFDFHPLKNKANTRAIRELQKMYPIKPQKEPPAESLPSVEDEPTHDHS